MVKWSIITYYTIRAMQAVNKDDQSSGSSDNSIDGLLPDEEDADEEFKINL